MNNRPSQAGINIGIKLLCNTSSHSSSAKLLTDQLPSVLPRTDYSKRSVRALTQAGCVQQWCRKPWGRLKKAYLHRFYKQVSVYMCVNREKIRAR